MLANNVTQIGSMLSAAALWFMTQQITTISQEIQQYGFAYMLI